MLTRLLAARLLSETPHRFELDVVDGTATSGQISLRFEATSVAAAEWHVRCVTLAAEHALDPGTPLPPGTRRGGSPVPPAGGGDSPER